MLLVIGLALFFSYRTMEKDWENGSIVRQIRSSVTELNSFVQSYIHYHGERPKQQFLAEHDAVTQLIAGIRLRNPDQQRLLDNIRRNSDFIKDSFLKLVSNYEHPDPAVNVELFGEAEERLEGQLMIRSRDMDADASRLRSMVDDDIRNTQTKTFILILFVMVLTAVSLTVVMVRTVRSITASISTLSKGTEVVGSGNLGYKINMQSEDELGEFARSFDNMTERLQTVTVSKDRLQQEVEERKRAEGALIRAKEEWERTFDTVPDLIAILDTRHQIVRVNKAMADRLGLTPEQCIGLTCYRVVHGLSHPPEFCPHSRTCRDRSQHAADVHEPRLGGDFLVSTTPLCDESGQLIGTVHVARDITERKQAENEIKSLNEELRRHVLQLETANSELDAFSYSVSHDLRSPLRSIDGFSLALLEDYAAKLDDNARDSLGRVRAASQLMGRIIDDLLNLSRVSLTEIRREQVNLSAIALKIADKLRKAEPERQVEFVIAEDLFDKGDEHLLNLAIENLLSNAWKFTGKAGKARIEFGANPPLRPSQEGTIYFIRDNGAGFDMVYADKLFNPFQRMHTVKEFPGTGIGLATVKRIINRHGGRVWIEGEVGKGTTVFFTL